MVWCGFSFRNATNISPPASAEREKIKTLEEIKNEVFADTLIHISLTPELDYFRISPAKLSTFVRRLIEAAFAEIRPRDIPWNADLDSANLQKENIGYNQALKRFDQNLRLFLEEK